MLVILKCEPVWGPAPVVMGLYGLTRAKLLGLAKSGHVRARKENPESRSSRIIFRLADVSDWLENEAEPPRAAAFEARHLAAFILGVTDAGTSSKSTMKTIRDKCMEYYPAG